MSAAAKLFTLACLVCVVKAVGAQSSPSAISGKLSENGVPIADANIFLQVFDDEKCVKLFTNTKGDRESEEKLESCMHDVSTTSPDAAGHYQFASPTKGWYTVHFLWNIGKKPSHPPFSFKQGHWVVMYAGYKDASGKYDTMAQDSPFLFAGNEDVIRDFDMLSMAQEAPQTLRGRLSLPTNDWGVVLEVPGFVLKTVETKPDGRRYMVVENENTKVVVSITLEQSKERTHASSCGQSLEQKTKHAPMKIQNVRFARSGDFEVMRYMVLEFQGQRVNQESLFGCQFYDSTYIDLHISKVNYATTDEPLFAEVLTAIRIAKVQRSSAELVGQASRLYLQHDYNGAIGPYAQALDLEKVNPSLDKPLWYVLIDNLGMSYGITGNLQKAKETFEYGVSKDPEYPIFYYNLACTYAEMNDATTAGDYLRKAFDYKANVLPGESMPDPRTDDSFRKLMKDKQFRQLAEELAKSR